MGWIQTYAWTSPFIGPVGAEFGRSLRGLQTIERCFIRKDHECGKMKGASKSCFVACPSDDELEPILELISEKLAKVGIEAVIAVKERAYGQDIFCTKICGKIIEARFCLVILDDSPVEDKNIPNPNVYYEYGLMTSLEKHIIPLQKEGLELAFNIQSYDTIKYNSRNIGTELDRAIKDAIKITEESKEPARPQSLSQKAILRSFELAGFETKDSDWFLDDVINDTNFKGFSHREGGFYLYLGKIDDEDDVTSYLEDMSVVIHRTEKHYQQLENRIEGLKRELEELKQSERERERRITFRGRSSGSVLREMEKWTEAKEWMSKMYLGFIISPDINRTVFMRNAKELVSAHDTFLLAVDKNGEIPFGDVGVKLGVHIKSGS